MYMQFPKNTFKQLGTCKEICLQNQESHMFISLKHVSQNQIVEIVKEDNSGHFKNQTLNISK